MNISGYLAATMLNSIVNIYNNATLIFYSGTPGQTPTSVETAPTGTPLCSWVLPNPAIAPLSYPAVIANGAVSVLSHNIVAATQNPTTGIVAYGRIWVWVWLTGITVSPQSYCFSNGNLYYTTLGGVTGITAPSVTTGSISDGTVTWTFVEVANNGTQGHALSDYSINTSNADIIIGSTNLQNGVGVTITNVSLSLPV